MDKQEPIRKIPNLLRSRKINSLPDNSNRRRFTLPVSKLAVFGALAAAMAAGMGYYARLQLAGQANFFGLLVIAALFFLASFYDFVLSKDKRWRLYSGGIQILFFSAFFYFVELGALMSALGILVLFYLLAAKATLSRLDNSLSFSSVKVSQLYIRKIFTGFALAIIVLYLPQGDGQGNVFVSREHFQRFYDSTSAFIGNFWQGIDLNSSVGDFAEDIVRLELATNVQFHQLPEDLKDQAVKDNAENIVSEASRDIGFNLTPEMSLSEAFYLYLQNLFNRFQNQFGQSFVAVWGAALFAIVWSLGKIFVWLISLISFLIYETLSALNVIHLTGETRTKETIELT